MSITGATVASETDLHVQHNLLLTEAQWTAGDLVLHNVRRQAQLCIMWRRISISLWGLGSSHFPLLHIELSDRTFSLQVCIGPPEG